MILISIYILGLIFGKDIVSAEIFRQLGDVFGDNAAQQIKTLINNQAALATAGWSAIIGFGILAFSASGMFNQIHSSFNEIWQPEPRIKSSVLSYIVQRGTAFLILIVSFFLLFVSTSINSFLVRHSRILSEGDRVYALYEHWTSFLVLSILFALIFQFLSDARHKVWISLSGGMFTSLFFILGKIGVSAYLQHSTTASIFGSASILALIMTWVYYISQIVFLGACFIKILSDTIYPKNIA